MNTRPSPLAVKLAASVLVAGVLLALFLFRGGRQPAATPAGPEPVGHPETIALLDGGIDSVLAGFGVAPASIKKRSYEIAGEGFTRTERFVSVPDTIVPVAVNDALNDMARRFNARAAASENVRLRLVTIHLELDGRIVHTIVLRKSPRDSSPGERRLRPAT